MKNCKCVYAFQNVHGMVSVVNYNGVNGAVNDFLHCFDAWGSRGKFDWPTNDRVAEVWFELPAEMWELLHMENFKTAFKRMNAELVFDYHLVKFWQEES